MKQRIAVTGATGFIGRALCNHLLADGLELRVLVRDTGRLPPELTAAAEVVVGGLDDADKLARLVDGADFVVHCAGRVRGATRAQFDRANVQGTANVLRAAAAAESPPRLMLMSSLAAREPEVSHYAASKYAAEQLVEQAGERVPAVILRPPAVYGPGDREMLRLFRLMAKGMALVPGPVDARFSLIYVDDLCRAVLAWVHNETPLAGRFTVDDGRHGGYDWPEMCRIVGEVCGRRVTPRHVGFGLLDAAAWLNGRIGAAFDTGPMLTPEKLRELRHPDWVCDSVEFSRATGWRPQTELAAGLRSTPGWPGSRGALA